MCDYAEDWWASACVSVWVCVCVCVCVRERERESVTKVPRASGPHRHPSFDDGTDQWPATRRFCSFFCRGCCPPTPGPPSPPRPTTPPSLSHSLSPSLPLSRAHRPVPFFKSQKQSLETEELLNLFPTLTSYWRGTWNFPTTTFPTTNLSTTTFSTTTLSPSIPATAARLGLVNDNLLDHLSVTQVIDWLVTSLASDGSSIIQQRS